jgi:hypothetical protein
MEWANCQQGEALPGPLHGRNTVNTTNRNPAKFWDAN